jgi:hypothetical protein
MVNIRVSIAINTFGLLEGDLPSRILGYVVEWGIHVQTGVNRRLEYAIIGWQVF